MSETLRILQSIAAAQIVQTLSSPPRPVFPEHESSGDYGLAAYFDITARLNELEGELMNVFDDPDEAARLIAKIEAESAAMAKATERLMHDSPWNKVGRKQ